VAAPSTKIVLWGVGILMLGGCAGAYSEYLQPGTPNLTVDAHLENDSSMNTVAAFLVIYKMDDECNERYIGTKKLFEGENDLGIPVDHLMQLEFRFSREAGIPLLTRDSSFSSQAMLFIAKPNKRYLAKVTYANGLYYTEIFEETEQSAVEYTLPSHAFHCFPKQDYGVHHRIN